MAGQANSPGALSPSALAGFCKIKTVLHTRAAVYYKELCRGLSLNEPHSIPQIIPELLRLVIELITAIYLSFSIDITCVWSLCITYIAFIVY